MSLPKLCGDQGCRLILDHTGKHSKYPARAWGFMAEKDKDKLAKAGFATPRGGRKGAYQNHVLRCNRVIIPYERLATAPLDHYKDGYTVRVYPEQYFQAPGMPKAEFQTDEATVVVGRNAFVLYRTHEAFERLPPLREWFVRRLEKDGRQVEERGEGVEDTGHYVLRISAIGEKKIHEDGPPQGVFAPEYADDETNYFCRCVLAWLIIQTVESPYTTAQAEHLQAILVSKGLLDAKSYEFNGVLRHGLCCCPLCLRFIKYSELHETVSFEDASGLENAAEQVIGATRSTIVNLFHLIPLTYDAINHVPEHVAWGHAVCNTRLGQRPCLSLEQIKAMNRKVGIVKPEGIETFGWISEDYQMIRSPKGAVWIQLNGDFYEGEPLQPAGAAAPNSSK